MSETSRCCICRRAVSSGSPNTCPDCLAVVEVVGSRPDLAAKILREKFGYCVIAMRPRTYAASLAAD